jgi:predicted nucleotidyltransferase
MNQHIEKLIIICKKFNAVELYSFGSRSREIFEYVNGVTDTIQQSSSDIDIGVRFSRSQQISAEIIVKMTLDLEDYFRVSRVDLVLLEDAPPFLALDIIRGELLYAENLDDQARYELYVMARAGDLMYFEKKRRENNLSVR